jgi:hypothetical protein
MGWPAALMAFPEQKETPQFIAPTKAPLAVNSGAPLQLLHEMLKVFPTCDEANGVLAVTE